MIKIGSKTFNKIGPKIVKKVPKHQKRGSRGLNSGPGKAEKQGYPMKHAKKDGAIYLGFLSIFGGSWVGIHLVFQGGGQKKPI